MARALPSFLALAVLAAGGAFAGTMLRRAPESTVTPDGLDAVEVSRDAPKATGVETAAYRELVGRLRNDYVDTVPPDIKLASGAVKGMVGHLDDPESTFMDKEEFAAELAARKGTLQGIGARFALVTQGGTASTGANGTPEEVLATVPKIARLTVVGLARNGPADKAGVRIGDMVYEVDDHWVANTDLIIRFREASKRYDEKKITMAELNKLRKEVLAKMDRALLPLKAREKLVTGRTGNVTVVWERGSERRRTVISKAVFAFPGQNWAARRPAYAPALVVTKAGVAGVAKEIAGRKAVTLDLRNQPPGDLAGLRDAVALLAPRGDYGTLRRAASLRSIQLTSEAKSAPKVTFLVDRSVRGPAQVLARALADRKVATLSGPPMDDARRIAELHSLPDGTGYTLATAEYVRPKGAR